MSIPASHQYLSDLREFFSQHALLDYSGLVRKAANFNLHIQDGHHRHIQIEVNALQSSMFIRFSQFFSEPSLVDCPVQF